MTTHLEADRAGLHVNETSRGPSIATSNGNRFFVFDPRPEDIDIQVIAHALGMLCRYNGHCAKFYSVAEHSVFVSELLESMGYGTRVALIGLLHDAAEAYTGDLVRPIKVAMADEGVEILAVADRRISRAVYEKEELDPVQTDMTRVKWADNVALATEKRDLLPLETEEWAELPAPWDRKCVGLGPASASYIFMKQYGKLKQRLSEEAKCQQP